MKIQVKIVNQFGNNRTFPVDEKARDFTRLTGRQTFNPVDLATIKGLGFEVEYVGTELLNH